VYHNFDNDFFWIYFIEELFWDPRRGKSLKRLAYVRKETNRKIEHRPEKTLEIDLGSILKNPLISFSRWQTKQPERKMAAINKIKVTSLLLTETIIAKVQALLFQFFLFGCLFSGKNFVRAKKTEL